MMSIVYLARHHPIQMSEQNRIIAILDFFHFREILANRVVDGIIHYGGRTHVVFESTLRERIMRAMYDSPLAGHSGYSYEYEAM